ncbi:hypothetical protein Baya_13730 [Bagarius yarrelli]|uniref:Uncharacterized protein n=1 Tax=Bagarius yarrelli TaxID=175774 RepID=A0A556V6X5_BAGYA|nr:hypothetical protein Baya_13730 [Bagarius yarrelli]
MVGFKKIRSLSARGRAKPRTQNAALTITDTDFLFHQEKKKHSCKVGKQVGRLTQGKASKLPTSHANLSIRPENSNDASIGTTTRKPWTLFLLQTPSAGVSALMALPQDMSAVKSFCKFLSLPLYGLGGSGDSSPLVSNLRSLLSCATYPFASG